MGMDKEKKYYGLSKTTNACKGKDQLDKLLEEYLDFDGGIFVEAGAVDGISQSNTLYFEKYRNWKGLLIEPVKELYEQCVKNRPGALCENYALVSKNHKASDLLIYTATSTKNNFPFTMSSAKGAFTHHGKAKTHATRGIEMYFSEHSLQKQKVKTSTLSKLLEKHSIQKFDLLSLDVEGFELEVLKGLDLEKHKPEFILLECNVDRLKKEIDQYLSNFYTEVARLSIHDYLYRVASKTS